MLIVFVEFRIRVSGRHWVMQKGKAFPYHRAITKYTPTWPRSFTPSKQELRSLVAKMKLIPNRAMLQDKRIIFCDDSIVRGTQVA